MPEEKQEVTRKGGPSSNACATIPRQTIAPGDPKEGKGIPARKQGVLRTGDEEDLEEAT